MISIVSNILILQFPLFSCCSEFWPFSLCLENLMALIQVSIQSCCFLVLYIFLLTFRYILYFKYFPDHLKYEYSAGIPESRRPLLFPSVAPSLQQASPLPPTLSRQWTNSLYVLYFIICFSIIILATTIQILLAEFGGLPKSERDIASIAFAGVLGVYVSCFFIIQYRSYLCFPPVCTSNRYYVSFETSGRSLDPHNADPGARILSSSLQYIHPGRNKLDFISQLCSKWESSVYPIVHLYRLVLSGKFEVWFPEYRQR